MGIPTGYSQYSLPTMGKDQKQIYDLYKSQLMGGLPQTFQSLLGTARGDIPQFEAKEKYAQDLFNQQIAPGIASRYAGSGIGSSSGMQNAIAGAGANLSSQLHAQRSDMMQQAMRDVLGIGNTLLGMPTEQFGLQKKPWASFLESLGSGLGSGLGSFGGLFGGSKLMGLF